MPAASNPPCATSGEMTFCGANAGASPSILAVVVLYQMAASCSPTLLSFCRALDESGLASQFRVLIYDNSPARQAVPIGFPAAIQYLHDPANGGVAAAYNAALQTAEKGGIEWLLLLDQDTEISADYLKTLCRNLLATATERRFAAWVPKIRSRNEIVSPARVLWAGGTAPLDMAFRGEAPGETAAINSGALLRVSSLQEIGGFNRDLRLDFLDIWVFNRLHRAGYRVYVLDAVLSHELSFSHLESVPLNRYQNFLNAEALFYQCCKSPLQNLFYCCFRLPLRLVKALVVPSRRRLFLSVLAHLTRHIRRSVVGKSFMNKRER